MFQSKGPYRPVLNRAEPGPPGSADPFSCPTSTRHRSVLRGIEEKTHPVDYIRDVETGPLVAPVLRWERGRTVRALFFNLPVPWQVPDRARLKLVGDSRFNLDTALV